MMAKIPKVKRLPLIERLRRSLTPRACASKVWTTKDGRQVRIGSMDDNHLCNTLRMLRRINDCRAMSLYNAPMPQGEYAQMAYEQEMAAMDPFDHIVPQHPLFESLASEAHFRGLRW